MRTMLLLALMSFALFACDTGDDYTYVLIETEYGDMKARLYNSTPQHRDNFIKLANEGFYDDLLFHRVMNGFMIQGGDPTSKGAPAGTALGMGGPGYEIDAEIGALHMKGALAAARNNNPQKRSSGSQFYIVQGSPVTEAALDQMGQRSNRAYTPEQKQLYVELGGTPQLDFDYTVFGEVVEGYEVIDAIAAVPTDANDRPVQDVKMKVSVIK